VTAAARILRTAAGLLVLALLVYFGRLDLRVLQAALQYPGLVVLAGGLVFLVFPLAALRWWLLTSALGYPMNLAWSVRTTFTGQFFNIFLPGAIGGDMVRVALAYRAAQRGISGIIFSVLMDRLSGLVALILLGICVVPALPARFHEPIYLLPWLSVSAALAVGAAVAILSGEHIAGLLERLPLPLGKRLARGAREVLAAMRIYRGRWRRLCFALGLSLFQFILVLSSIVILGQAMSLNALPISGYLVAGVWSLIANFLPLTPGGLGVGEAAFAQIATALETVPTGASYANVFLAMRILTILVSVLGLLPYLAQRSELSEARLAGSASPHASGAPEDESS
jgi:glycosyltransferase 2 family protein